MNDIIHLKVVKSYKIGVNETLGVEVSGLVSHGQTLFRAGHYQLQYKHPRSEGLAQFTGLKFIRPPVVGEC